METNAHKLAVARETLGYLGQLPARLATAPPGARRYSAEVAISLGNWLLWIAPLIEPNAPPCYKQTGGEPDSVSLLGRRFREVGLELWNSEGGKQCVGEMDKDEFLKAIFLHVSAALTLKDSSPKLGGAN